MMFEIKSPLRSIRFGVLFSLFTSMMPVKAKSSSLRIRAWTSVREQAVPDSIAHSCVTQESLGVSRPG